MAYFIRTGSNTYVPTEHTTGAWNAAEQHIAPAVGLLAHELERDLVTRRQSDLVISRLSYDIWGTVPMGEVATSVEIIRHGRTIELLGATLTHAGRTVLTLRAWAMKKGTTHAFAGSELLPIPGPETVPSWDPTKVWPGGLIASLLVRRREDSPGRATIWVRSAQPLLNDQEPVSRFALTVGLLDVVNGMTTRNDPATVAFPNLDLTVHFMRRPVGDWVGFDATVSFGPDGVGVISSVLHDEHGPLGVMAQTLTVRPT